MNNYLEKYLRKLWLGVSGFSLLLPIMTRSSLIFEETMVTAIATMYVLSLPISFFATPLLLGLRFVLEMQPHSMLYAYFYLALLNLLGYIQWFWLTPRFLEGAKPFALPSILSNPAAEMRTSPIHPAWDTTGRTRLERIMDDDK